MIALMNQYLNIMVIVKSMGCLLRLHKLFVTFALSVRVLSLNGLIIAKIQGVVNEKRKQFNLTWSR